ncbi:ATP-binding protein [Actinomadura coerulea]|uniref:ATP-binding protein n=1 Tax=Actinomadura coerulea TaxID=46159 RepID=UPI003439A41D
MAARRATKGSQMEKVAGWVAPVARKLGRAPGVPRCGGSVCRAVSAWPGYGLQPLARPRGLTDKREVRMRIAPRAVTPPILQSTEGSSCAAGSTGRSEPSTRLIIDGALDMSNGPAVCQVRDDKERTAADGDDRLWRIDAPGVTDAVPLLRRWVRLLLSAEPRMAEAFELIVSEYGTNALWHSASGAPGGRIRVELLVRSHQTLLTVLDDGPATTRMDEEVDPAEHGRGLLLADAYADETGQDDRADGHAAWALINH